MSTETAALTPPSSPGLLNWLRRNLFSNWFNAILTIVSLTIIYFALVGSITWIFRTADWRPVTGSPVLYLIGQYPRDQMWRTGLSLWLVVFLIGMSWGVWERYVKAFAIFLSVLLGVLALVPLTTPTFTLAIRAAFLVCPILIYLGHLLARRAFIKSGHVAILWAVVSAVIVLVLLPGFEGSIGLRKVETTAWGGLLVTLCWRLGVSSSLFQLGFCLRSAAGPRSRSSRSSPSSLSRSFAACL